MRPERSDEELQELSDHLAYEVEMVCWQARYMTEALIDKVGRDLPYQAIPARNALVEAFALHVRVVSDFLYRPKPRYQSDAVAWDYVPDWQPPPMEPWLKKVNARIGPEIAHLSYKRNTIPKEARNWHFLDIRDELAVVVRELLPRMQDRQLHPMFRQRVENALPPAPQPEAPPVPPAPNQKLFITPSTQVAGTATVHLL